MPENEFDPTLPARTQERIRHILGPTWDRIWDADQHGLRASPANPRRHILAGMYENVSRFSLREVAEHYPGRLPDLLGLVTVANILERSSGFPVFRELVSSMDSQEGFRHHMLTLGLADHLLTHTRYTVDLPVPDVAGRRTVDMRIGSTGGPVMEVETKTSDEFDGPRREVSTFNARRAISRAWKKKVSGPHAQLGGALPGLLLLGGVTLKVESLDVIAAVATSWLEDRGRTHPNLWGIVCLTYWTYTLGPPPAFSTPGATVDVHARGGVQLRVAENPFYTGPIRIVLTPYVAE